MNKSILNELLNAIAKFMFIIGIISLILTIRDVYFEDSEIDIFLGATIAFLLIKTKITFQYIIQEDNNEL